MHYKGYIPATIINAGVGPSPEIHVWRWLFGDSKIIGIDPKSWTRDLRNRLPKNDYIQALLGSEEGVFRSYCPECQAIECLRPRRSQGHQSIRQEIKQTTIDVIAKEFPPPYFIWMDIDGGELDALNGALETLKHTRFINIEMIRPRFWPKTRWEGGKLEWDLRKFLWEHNFVEAYRSPFQEDVMYEMRSETWKKFNGESK